MKADSHGTSCERRAYGKALRDEVPRSSHASWNVETGRERPLELMLEQESERLAYLVGERRLRMSASPFAFFRGNALVMAADLATTPSTGLRVQACGDAHIANFGGFAASDRRLVFDVNDFDETAPGPWEWDVKRLAASIEICGRDRGFSRSWRRGAVRAAAESYRRAMASFARAGELDVWYARLDVDEVVAPALERADEARRARVRRRLKKAYANTSERAFDRFVRWEDGEPRIAFDPPFVVPLDRFAPALDAARAADGLVELLAGYRLSLAPETRLLFDRFDFLDAAQKVVGVGSVGTRAWIVACAGRSRRDPLVLQVKEAQPSVLERFAGPCGAATCGERVVRGQRLMQASGDILLGWTSAEDEDGRRRAYYVRQLWDCKTSTDLETAEPDEIAATGCLSAWTLARAHARSGDRCAIAGYLGSSSAFDRAIAGFAAAYADQNEADYRVFIDALSGSTLAAPGGAGGPEGVA